MTTYVSLCSCCGQTVPTWNVWWRGGWADVGLPFCKHCVGTGGTTTYCHTPEQAIANARAIGIALPPGGSWGR